MRHVNDTYNRIPIQTNRALDVMSLKRLCIRLLLLVPSVLAFIVGGGGRSSISCSTRMPITKTTRTTSFTDTSTSQQRLHQSQLLLSAQLQQSLSSRQQPQHDDRSRNGISNNSVRHGLGMTNRYTILSMNAGSGGAAADGSSEINGLGKNNVDEATGMKNNFNMNNNNNNKNDDPFEQQIKDLSKEWRSLPSQEVEDRLSKLETELRWEIATLTKKLKLAEAQRIQDKDLQDMMRLERQALEREISKAKRDTTTATMKWKKKQEEDAAKKEEEARYKSLYEQELQTRQSQEEEAQLEIKRLQEEVRIVFSVGRRTSDKLVENLTARLEESEDQLQSSLDDLATKEEMIAQLKQERESLRKLGRLSIRLAWQRLRYRLRLLRYKLLPLPPLNPDASKNDKSDAKVRVGGRRMKKSSSSRRRRQRSREDE